VAAFTDTGKSKHTFNRVEKGQGKGKKREKSGERKHFHTSHALCDIWRPMLTKVEIFDRDGEIG
jgi:hypothetical protein